MISALYEVGIFIFYPICHQKTNSSPFSILLFFPLLDRGHFRVNECRKEDDKSSQMDLNQGRSASYATRTPPSHSFNLY